MKRTGHLIADVVSPQNMRLAFVRAVKGQRSKPIVVNYEKHLDKNLAALAERLSTAAKQWGPYFCFTIFDPKEREIKVAPLDDRIGHHALMNVCQTNFEQFQIFDSYASRVGKGQFACLERAKHFCCQNKWYLKLDIRKYFDSIPHGVLKQQLQRRFKDIYLLENFHNIIDSYEHTSKRGVPIGNLTSQFFANHFLAVLDHFVKEKLQVRSYVRYMDDFVLWANEADTLKRHFAAVENFLTDELQLVLKPSCLNRSTQGMTFLGFRLFPNRMGLSHRSRYRFRRKLKVMRDNFVTGIWNERIYAKHLETLFAFVRHGESKNFRLRVMRELSLGTCSIETGIES